jgi:superfamily II DNA or RNA helicase
MKNLIRCTFLVLTFFVTVLSSSAFAAKALIKCQLYFDKMVAAPKALSFDAAKLPRKLTLIEKEFSGRTPPLTPEDRLLVEISKIAAVNPELATRINEAKDIKSRGKSLKIDLSGLPSHMVFFLIGPYKRIVGNRGLSKPFVQIKLFDSNTLLIHHEGDLFPLLVRWNDAITTVSRPTVFVDENKIYQFMEIPGALKSLEALKGIQDKYINSLISGSAINRFIPSTSSSVMTTASLLHDGKLFFDRPTQVEAKAVRELLNTRPELRQKVKSLLFVAPTATGKTRVLGDTIINKINFLNRLKIGNNSQGHDKKVIVLMTRTPDLTSNLARDIGEQLFAEIGPQGYRLIQWGGELSENMTLGEFEKFVEASNVPVVLVTSYPTLASRAPSPLEKNKIFRYATALLIDEAHNVGGDTFEQVFAAATAVARADRASNNTMNSLDILGVTASPITRIQRTVELFDASFWAAVESPGIWADRVVRAHSLANPSDNVLEWYRISQQYENARDRGEINASEPIFYSPIERGFSFSSIFERGASGTQSSVSIEKLQAIWPDVAKMIEGHGPGIIHTYPRDAEAVAQLLSKISGKNYVSLQKLNVSERGEIYEAFKKRTLYKGQTVDAIVGTIREGLDFPQAGWYLSFKKYVKFPENIQGPGRVVRLALNKLTPKIIFFGEDINKITYGDVKELILSRLGRLPNKLPEGRLYSGARKLPETSSLGAAAQNVNVALEALLRIRSDLTKQLGEKSELNSEAVSAIQNLLLEIRSSGQNREIADAFKKFIFEVNAYAFFTGDLHSTWNYCDRILALAKKGEAVDSMKNLKSQDLEVLKNPELLKQIVEFRSLYAALGLVPRSILAKMELRPANIYEITEATNVFVKRNERLPYSLNNSPASLAYLMLDIMRTSPETFWRRSNYKTRNLSAGLFEERSKITFESILQEFYNRNGTFPKLDVETIGSHDNPGIEVVSEKLADELVTRLKAGDLDVSLLSRELILTLDQSDLYAGLMLKVLKAFRSLELDIESQTGHGFANRLAFEGILNYENLMTSGDFKILQIVKNLDEKLKSDGSNSRKYRQMMETLLKPYSK